jgi:hypothetical protein
MLESGVPVDEVIRMLRDADVDVVDSIWLLGETKALRPAEAKAAVLHSPVWADVQPEFEAFQEGRWRRSNGSGNSQGPRIRVGVLTRLSGGEICP